MEPSTKKDKPIYLAVFNSVVHIGANPALMGFISRPDSVERHTLENIKQTGYYTINHFNKDIFEKAHQTSARYKREQSEFDATGLKIITKIILQRLLFGSRIYKWVYY